MPLEEIYIRLPMSCSRIKMTKICRDVKFNHWSSISSGNTKMTSLNSGYHWNIWKKRQIRKCCQILKKFFLQEILIYRNKNIGKKIAKCYPLSLVRNKQSNEIKSIIIHELVEHIVISKGKVTGKVLIHNTNETFSYTKLNFLTKSR